MKKVLFIDDFNGISGDILLSCFIDAGFNINILEENLKKIDISSEVKIIPKKINSFGITGTNLNIDQKPLKSRNYKEIRNLIENSQLNENIKKISLKILKNLAEAESKIHSIALDEVHFHEIGGVDTIIDAVGVATAVDFFEIKECYISNINVGRGEIKTSHGIYPNPAPATIELLKGYNLKFLDINAEITTPTGAAIIKSLNCKYNNNLTIIPEKIGYGFGKYKFADRPNCSRIIIGEKLENQDSNSKIIEINFNIDDMTGEEIGYFIKEIVKKDILDISIIPTLTKKNRPGYLVMILVKELKEDLLKFIFSNTTTSGIRFSEKDRIILDRYYEGNKKIFKSEKLKIKKWKLEFDKI